MADIVTAQTNNDVSVKVDKVLEKIGQFFPSVLPVLNAENIDGLKQEEVVSFLNVSVDEIFEGNNKTALKRN